MYVLHDRDITHGHRNSPERRPVVRTESRMTVNVLCQDAQETLFKQRHMDGLTRGNNNTLSLSLTHMHARTHAQTASSLLQLQCDKWRWYNTSSLQLEECVWTSSPRAKAKECYYHGYLCHGVIYSVFIGWCTARTGVDPAGVTRGSICCPSTPLGSSHCTSDQ